MVNKEREERIICNLPLVHSIANRFRGRGADYEDLYQAGCVGLIKAVDGFDEEKGFQFSTYAVPVIMGEIKRIFRDGGALKVSRSLKEKSVCVQRAKEEFEKLYEREPHLSELAEFTGISTDELPEILNVTVPVLSLSCFGESDDEELDIPFDESDRLFDRLSVLQALSSFNKTEQLLIKLRFYEGKTQAETAKILKISQVQVSRKEKKILLLLRKKLGDY